MLFFSKNTQLGYQVDFQSVRLMVGQQNTCHNNIIRIVLLLDETNHALVETLKQNAVYLEGEIFKLHPKTRGSQCSLNKTYRLDSNYFSLEKRKLLFEIVEDYLLKQSEETPTLNDSTLERKKLILEGVSSTQIGRIPSPKQIVECLNVLRNIVGIDTFSSTLETDSNMMQQWIPIRLERTAYLDHLKLTAV